MWSSEYWISSNHHYARLTGYAAVDVPQDAGSLCCCQDTLFDSALACCHPRTPSTFSAELLPILQCYYKDLIPGAFALAGFLEASVCPVSSHLPGSLWMGPCPLALFRDWTSCQLSSENTGQMTGLHVLDVPSILLPVKAFAGHVASQHFRVRLHRSSEIFEWLTSADWPAGLANKESNSDSEFLLSALFLAVSALNKHLSLY